MWIPSRGEERYLNVISFLLVVALLSLGFEILKLPAAIAPNRPPLAQFVGFCDLAVLNMALIWNAARDDYVRLSYGFPRALASFAVVTLITTGGFLLRGLWDGTYALDTSREIAWNDVLTILIGGQFATMAFFATFLLAKSEATKVRQFKRDAGEIRSFARRLEKGLEGREFDTAYSQISAKMIDMPTKAAELGQIVVAAEANYALKYANAANQVAEVFKHAPTPVVAATLEAIRKADPATLATLTQAWLPRQRKAPAG
jgi:hypothetical protein